LGLALAFAVTALAGFFDESVFFPFELSYVDLAVFDVLFVLVSHNKQRSGAIALRASVLFQLAR
jgi:hypothetical protein